MSGRFVLTSQVDPPAGRTLMCRSSGSVFESYLSKWSGWRLLVQNGEVSMAEPPKEWWLSDALAKELNITVPETIADTSAQMQHRRGQLALNFDGQDSGKLSSPQ
jgi:hypothetical protein